MPKLEFPKGFLWGAATSSYQVEGGLHNEWTEWEKTTAVKRAKEAREESWHDSWRGYGKKERNPEFAEEASDPNNYLSGIACDHWNRYEEDFDILEELHLNTYRFSIEWSRIEPEEGRFDDEAIGHYKKMIASLRRRGVEPFVTLWHFWLPVWVAKKGGVASKKFPERFARYAERMAAAFGSDVKFYVTINEPDMYASFSYLLGFWPPEKRSLRLHYVVTKRIEQAHKLAYLKMKGIAPDTEIGITKQFMSFQVLRRTPISLLTRRFADWWWNYSLLDRLMGYQDYIGFNYYQKKIIGKDTRDQTSIVRTDIDWEYDPESIYDALIALKRYDMPIYITENGIADAFDRLRGRFITETLTSIHQAIKEGTDVRGYIHWSLLDNFELDKGFWPRFGLVQMEYATQKRTIRESARIYGKIAETNTLDG
ncbi:MAG: glycoside hydrolase family 1 protein [Candidatus Moranbacteria bacterium]|nr:glycoside hydrolase family 1 protein [Candidatus Moranbacteria bacterium]